jgi:hypothetical protein
MSEMDETVDKCTVCYKFIRVVAWWSAKRLCQPTYNAWSATGMALTKSEFTSACLDGMQPREPYWSIIHYLSSPARLRSGEGSAKKNAREAAKSRVVSAQQSIPAPASASFSTGDARLAASRPAITCWLRLAYHGASATLPSLPVCSTHIPVKASTRTAASQACRLAAPPCRPYQADRNCWLAAPACRPHELLAAPAHTHTPSKTTHPSKPVFSHPPPLLPG